MFRSLGIKTLLVPIATITGTLAFSALAALMISRYSVYDCMAVGSGFGYYSLSSVFITQYKGAELGTVALMANIFREIITLLFAPLLVRFFSPLAPICAGGATTMDTTLGVITRFSGREYVFIAVFPRSGRGFHGTFFRNLLLRTLIFAPNQKNRRTSTVLSQNFHRFVKMYVKQPVYHINTAIKD